MDFNQNKIQFGYKIQNPPNVILSGYNYETGEIDFSGNPDDIVYYVQASHEVPFDSNGALQLSLPANQSIDLVLFSPTLLPGLNAPIELSTTYIRDHISNGIQPAQTSFVGVWDHAQTYNAQNGNFISTSKRNLDSTFFYNHCFQMFDFATFTEHGGYYYATYLALTGDMHWHAYIYNIQTGINNELADIPPVVENGKTVPAVSLVTHSFGWECFEGSFVSLDPSDNQTLITVCPELPRTSGTVLNVWPDNNSVQELEDAQPACPEAYEKGRGDDPNAQFPVNSANTWWVKSVD